MAIDTCITTDIAKAARFIQDGELVAFPTETVYGLGANAYDTHAVEKIYMAKGRPATNPLIVHVGAVQDVEKAAVNIPELAKAFIERFFPGPLTLILERHPSLPKVVSAGLPTVGVRMPDHEVARVFIQASERLVAAPSANLSGKPSPTTWEAVQEDLGGRISCILQGEMSMVGLESTVVDCTVDPPQILRSGSTTLTKLQNVVPSTIYSPSVEPGNKDRPRSPGTTFKHYTPAARVMIVDHAGALSLGPNRVSTKPPAEPCAFIGLDAPPDISVYEMTLIAAGVEDYARTLFDFFRRCDRAGIVAIYCQSVTEQELGHALMDRIRRAAAR